MNTTIHMNRTNLDYLLTINILEDLKSKKLITEKEFELIDLENKKAFKIA